MSTYEYNKEWRKRNPNKLKEQQRRYREKHREELNKKHSIYDRARAEKRFNDNIENLANYIEKMGF